MYFVYIIKNSNGKYYVGQTGNLKNRLERHNKNRCGFTKNKGNWKLVRQETFLTRGEAMQRENYIKSQKSRKFIEGLISP